MTIDNATVCNSTVSNVLIANVTMLESVAPTVSGGVTISGASGVQNSLLNTGDVVSVTATFSENVSVTGTPQLTLLVGTTDRTATYTSGSGGTTLVFQYTIQAGETDSDGISIRANVLALNSGTISDASGNNATLAHSSVANNLSFMVDTTAPTLAQVTAVAPLTSLTPTYTFSSNEAGTITYAGECSSTTTSASVDNNTITLATLSDGETYDDCTTTVTDTAGNISDTLTITQFAICTNPKGC